MPLRISSLFTIHALLLFFPLISVMPFSLSSLPANHPILLIWQHLQPRVMWAPIHSMFTKWLKTSSKLPNHISKWFGLHFINKCVCARDGHWHQWNPQISLATSIRTDYVQYMHESSDYICLDSNVHSHDGIGEIIK